MEFNISNLIVNINKQNMIQLVCAFLSALAAFGSFLTSKKVIEQNLFNRRIEHYRQLMDIIKNFRKLIPFTWNENDKKYNIDKQRIKKSVEAINALEELRFMLDTLKREAEYLFNQDVSKFENDFMQILYYCKFLLMETEQSIFQSREQEISAFIDRIANRNEIFDKDLKKHI